jgi:hypothetical protein
MSHQSGTVIIRRLAEPALAETHEHEAAPAKSVKVWHVLAAVFLAGLTVGLLV